MYLANSELTKVIGDLVSDCDNKDHPFDAAEQVKVCSIDLRLGNIFWVARLPRRNIDLGANLIYEVSPRRLWKRIIVQDGECVKLRPGEMILGRTYEKISMPTHLVGKLNTRGSYARLGLSTACNCDLVNPGYVGHVPLELTNASKNTILLRPYLPLCQLFLMPLQGVKAGDSYSSEKYHSKYMNDDGGPSVWWRDRLAKKISAKVLNSQMADNVILKLEGKFEGVDDDCLFRLEKFVEGRQFSNSEELLARFAELEADKSWWYSIRRGISIWLFPILIIPSAMQVQNKLLTPGELPDLVTWALWGAFVVALPFFAYYKLKPEVRFYKE